MWCNFNQKDNFVDPYYRQHKTFVYKTDHPTLGHKNQGHLLNDNRAEAE